MPRPKRKMDQDAAALFLKCLTEGDNPNTRKPYRPGENVLTPKVIEALQIALDIVNRLRLGLLISCEPVNRNQPWRAEEDEQLRIEVEKFRGIAEMAVAHGRTVHEIETRMGQLNLYEFYARSL